MGKLVYQLFALGQQPPFLLHIFFKPCICRFQSGKGLLKIISHRIEAYSQFSEFIIGRNGAWSGKVQFCHLPGCLIEF